MPGTWMTSPMELIGSFYDTTPSRIVVSSGIQDQEQHLVARETVTHLDQEALRAIADKV